MLTSSSSSTAATPSMPLDKVCDLVCAHAELQAEHDRLKKKVKLLQAEIEELSMNKQKETNSRIETLAMNTDRHVQSLSLNCDDTMRRKCREVDEIMASMRREMFDRVSAAIASAPPPDVKRMRQIAYSGQQHQQSNNNSSQVMMMSSPSQNHQSKENTLHHQHPNNNSNHHNNSSSSNQQQQPTPMARRVHALSELVSMTSNESSMNEINNQHHNPTMGILNSSSNNNNNINNQPQYSHHQQNNASSSSASAVTGTGISSPQPSQQLRQTPAAAAAQVRYDLTPGLNVSNANNQPQRQADGDLLTFLW